MAKATRAKETTTPKRNRKAKPEDGTGTQVAGPVTTSPGQSVERLPELVTGQPVTLEQPIPEEKIRLRAYQIYLERRGQGGSPEQDWLQAAAEIRSQSVA